MLNTSTFSQEHVMNETQFSTETVQSRQTYWSQHIENCNRSGLTQVQYCRDNDLNKHTFAYWKSKLNRQSIFRPLLPVSIRPDRKQEISSFPSGISLSFDDRFKVQLEVGFKSDTLQKLIDLLQVR